MRSRCGEQSLFLTEAFATIDGVMAEDGPQERPERATPLLAIVRIVSVLGMSFGIAGGIFLMLGGWLEASLIAFAAAVPFFLLMRFMEKHAGN